MSDGRANPSACLRSRCGPRASPEIPSHNAGEVGANLESVILGLRQELVACHRLAMLGNITAMVTHEFNNLLTPLLARTEAALQSDDPAFMRTTLERARTQAYRAMNTTRHLLDLAHDQPPTSEVCSVTAAVREAVETMTRPCEKDNIELRLSIPDDLQVTGRADLLCQVVLNLLLNARKAMAGKPGTLAVTAAANGRYAEIDIRDTGCGIPADLIDAVFNPFLAADPNERPNDWQRVGLGLSVCRFIAHHYGATIRCTLNADGRGCTFHLRWPLANTASTGA